MMNLIDIYKYWFWRFELSYSKTWAVIMHTDAISRDSWIFTALRAINMRLLFCSSLVNEKKTIWRQFNIVSPDIYLLSCFLPSFNLIYRDINIWVTMIKKYISENKDTRERDRDESYGYMQITGLIKHYS